MPVEPSKPLLPDAPVKPSTSLIFRAIALFLFGLFAAFSLALFRAHTGPVSASVPALHLEGDALALTAGLRLATNNLSDGAAPIFAKTLVIARPAEDGSAIVALKLPPQVAANYRYVEAVIKGGVATGGVAFIYRGGVAKDKVRQSDFQFAGATALPVTLEPLDGWSGEIIGGAIAFSGPFTGPIELESVTFTAPSLAATAQRLLRGWFSFEKWDNSSINFIYGGPIDLNHPLPLYLFFGLLASLALFLVLVKDGRMVGDARIYWLLPLFFWLVGDVRWQISLLEQTRATTAIFAGKTIDEKHLSAEDGRIFKLMQSFGSKMPIGATATPGYRVFVFSDEEYTRGRAAYHLYPRNVFALPGQKELLPVRSYNPGDYILLVDKKGVRFNNQTQLLTWAEAEAVAVELLHYEAGNGLFKVRGATTPPATSKPNTTTP